jgi:hypothetical protein
MSGVVVRVNLADLQLHLHGDSRLSLALQIASQSQFKSVTSCFQNGNNCIAGCSLTIPDVVEVHSACPFFFLVTDFFKPNVAFGATIRFFVKLPCLLMGSGNEAPDEAHPQGL